ncbi:MAG: hypothetical protein V1861_06315 [Candidatus Micrarchaeota archaeon]
MSLLTSPAAFDDVFSGARANRTSLVRNKLADRIILEGKAELPRFWTGTVVAYPAPDCPFGESITFLDRIRRLRYILETSSLRGERGIALVLEPGTYDLFGKGTDRIYVPNRPPIILSGFPLENGWHGMDMETALPVRGTRAMRYLWRLSGEAIVPVARERGKNGWAASDIFLNQRPSARLAAFSQSDLESALAQERC